MAPHERAEFGRLGSPYLESPENSEQLALNPNLHPVDGDANFTFEAAPLWSGGLLCGPNWPAPSLGQAQPEPSTASLI
jgi:hypothetical protein